MTLGTFKTITAIVHLRRRLTTTEAVTIGPVLDVRRTPEAARRAAQLGERLALIPPDVLAEEVGQ